jgi:hypothetical protein
MKLRDSGRDDVLLFVIPSLFVIPEGNLRSAQITGTTSGGELPRGKSDSASEGALSG